MMTNFVTYLKENRPTAQPLIPISQLILTIYEDWVERITLELKVQLLQRYEAQEQKNY